MRKRTFHWTDEKDRILATIMCESARKAEPVMEGLFTAMKKLGSTMAVTRDRWYNYVKPEFEKEYAEARRLAGIPGSKVVIKPSAKPKAPSSTQAGTDPQLLKAVSFLKNNAQVVQAFSNLINENASLKAKISEQNKLLKLKDEEIKALDHRLSRFRAIQRGE